MFPIIGRGHGPGGNLRLGFEWFVLNLKRRRMRTQRKRENSRRGNEG
jgi:hypothetical protein